MPLQPFQVPYAGNGMIIGVNAVIHVFISHGLAIGGTAMLALGVLAEQRRPHPDWGPFLKGLLTFLMIALTGAGAVTGVGIWFTTSALAPNGIAAILRVFFWPWFIEWIVFVLEVVVLLILYSRWERRPEVRARFAIAYVLLAVMSGALISGILGFMLTPDGWPADGSFRSAFFNPTYIPQFLFRTSFAAALGALAALTMVAFRACTPEFKRTALGLYGTAAAIGLGATLLSGWMYWRNVPWSARELASFSLLTSHLTHLRYLLPMVNGTALTLVCAVVSMAILRNATAVRWLIVPALLSAAGLVAEFERAREFIRGPYLLPGYMYVNGITLTEAVSSVREPPAEYRSGLELFDANCSACHTLAGVNGICARVHGRTSDGVYVMLGRLHELAPFMPPFAGAARERRVLAEYLSNSAAQRRGKLR